MLKLFLTLFILVFSWSALAATGPCETILAEKSFHRQGYEKLDIEPPLTPEEAKNLHKKLVEFIHRTRPKDLRHYKILLRREPNDPIFLEDTVIEVQKEPELQALPEIQKVFQWIRKVERMMLVRLHDENPKVELRTVLFEVGTKAEPLYPNAPLKKHSDNDYARILNALVGTSTIVHEDGVRYQPPTLSSLLITGRMRFATGRVMATSHTSPDESEEDRLFLRMAFKEPDWEKLPRYVSVPESDVKDSSPLWLHPNMKQHGFEFLRAPISISTDEAQSLVNAVRAYYKNKGYPLKFVSLPILDNFDFAERVDKIIADQFLQKYLINISEPTYLKIRTQIETLMKNFNTYFPEDVICEDFHMGLRIGFQESPLYEKTDFGAKLQKFHQDGGFTRILAPLLGLPTEIYSSILKTRLDLPMGIATRITGKDLDLTKATFHRVRELAAEDRVLLVITCGKEPEIPAHILNR